MQKEQEHGESVVVESLVCPSFSTYSSNTLNDIADQVTREEHHHLNDNDGNQNDFEFLAFRKAADGVFFEGSQNASQVFPIFNRDLLAEHDGAGDGRVSDTAAIRIPFGKLLIGDEERGSDPSPPPSSTSSSEDDLEEIPAGTYCVWTPKSVKASPNRCKKSNSTGSSSNSSSSSSSSKRWKLLSLLRRSKSDGKESIVLLTPSSPLPPLGTNSAKKKGGKGENNSKEKCAGKKIPAPGEGGEKKFPASPLRSPSRSPYEALYGGKREIRRKSYLPYRQDLVGFCVSLNSIGRGFPLHV